jgi:hypothetical protein
VRLKEAWKPSHGNANESAVDKRYGERIVAARNVNGNGFTIGQRSTHSIRTWRHARRHSFELCQLMLAKAAIARQLDRYRPKHGVSTCMTGVNMQRLVILQTGEEESVAAHSQ